MTLHCPKCAYDLTALTVNRCPECGSAFDPAALRREQAIRRPRWWIALIAVLACAYGPFATWIPFQEHVEWFMLWPVLAGFFFGALLHPRGLLEFIVMGAATVLIVGGSWHLATRCWWALVRVCTLLLAWTSFNAWGAYAAMRM